MASTRWFSPENPEARRSGAGALNRGAKGRPFTSLPAGGTLTLLDTASSDARGPGTVQRIWLTLSDLSPQTIRGIRMRAWWDDDSQPAIDVPLGAFFGFPTGVLTRLRSHWFTSPEGRSLCATLPLPFATAARIELHNTAHVDVERVFYEIAVEFREHGLAERVHCVFAEATPVALDGPMTALELKGASGRLLGLQLGAVIDPRYGELWWGEGEVRIALGDDPAPTLSGTGIEDWAGTGWGMGEFSDPFQGCPIAGTDGHWTPYRLHVEDRVWFDGGIRVTVDAIGGGPADHVLALLASGAPGVPITIDRDGHPLRRLLDEPLAPGEDTSDGWMNFRRSDSYAATTWFALDTPAHAGM